MTEYISSIFKIFPRDQALEAIQAPPTPVQSVLVALALTTAQLSVIPAFPLPLPVLEPVLNPMAFSFLDLFPHFKKAHLTMAS